MTTPRPPQIGDGLFFKEAFTSTKRNATRLQFKGHAVGIWLGVVPHFAKEPQGTDLFKMMGSIGWLTFDDVGEFLGPEAGAKVVEMFSQKYSAPTPPTLEGEKAATDLTDSKGNPLNNPPSVV